MTAANDNVNQGNHKLRRSERPCPICGKQEQAQWQPFCSKRCADVDLHRWLGGHYAVSGDNPDEGANEP